jgi:hypothetical protein
MFRTERMPDVVDHPSEEPIPLSQLALTWSRWSKGGRPTSTVAYRGRSR